MPSQDLSKDACLSHIIALTWAVATLVRNAGPVLAAPLFWAAFARKDTASAEWAQSFAICINTQKMLHDVGSCQMAVAQTAWQPKPCLPSSVFTCTAVPVPVPSAEFWR